VGVKGAEREVAGREIGDFPLRRPSFLRTYINFGILLWLIQHEV